MARITKNLKDPGSAITHFIGMMMALLASVPLLLKAGLTSGPLCFTAMAVFMCSMVLLYAASTTYHTLNLSEKALRIFRKIDHMMIFVLIAGSYTPVCLITLGGKLGYTLLATVWGIAIFGITRLMGSFRINSLRLSCFCLFTSMDFASILYSLVYFSIYPHKIQHY